MVRSLRLPALLPITLLWVVIDLLVRPSVELRAVHWIWWLGSILFSVLMWEGLFNLSLLLHNSQRSQRALVFGTSLVAALLGAASVSFHRIFYCWPTTYAGLHILREPREALGYVLHGLNPLHAVEITAGFLLIAAVWHLALQKISRPRSRAYHRTLVLLLVTVCVTSGSVHRYASLMIPDAAGAKLLIDLGVNSLIGGVQGRLTQARRPPAEDLFGGLPVDENAPNVIVVLAESLSSNRTGLYGYQLQTTPNLNRLKESRPEDWVQFTKAVANASATKVSLPTMFTGLFPSREPVELHTFPLLWHYAHAAGYQTALVTSQSYAWNNLESYFIDDGLDHAFTLERSSAEIVNAEGMDDRVMLEEALETVDRFAEKGPFLLVLQFNCTHYPGFSPPEFGEWLQSESDAASYDNAVLYMDHLLGRLFKHLDDRNLSRNTSILFVADHGEDIEKVHEIHRTDSYYQSSIDIPLVFLIPEEHRRRLGAGFLQMRNNANLRVALSDLVPTTLELLGLAKDDRIDNWIQRLDGRSLFQPLDPERLLVVVNTDEHVMWSRKGYAVISEDWKYIYYSWTQPMLFDLANDPLEKNNLLAVDGLNPDNILRVDRVNRLVSQTQSLHSILED